MSDNNILPFPFKHDATEPPGSRDREDIARAILTCIQPGLALDDTVRIVLAKYPGLSAREINAAFAFLHRVLKIVHRGFLDAIKPDGGAA
jgi:hypothetical protein